MSHFLFEFEFFFNSISPLRNPKTLLMLFWLLLKRWLKKIFFVTEKNSQPQLAILLQIASLFRYIVWHPGFKWVICTGWSLEEQYVEYREWHVGGSNHSYLYHPERSGWWCMWKGILLDGGCCLSPDGMSVG